MWSKNVCEGCVSGYIVSVDVRNVTFMCNTCQHYVCVYLCMCVCARACVFVCVWACVCACVCECSLSPLEQKLWGARTGCHSSLCPSTYHSAQKVQIGRAHV